MLLRDKTDLSGVDLQRSEPVVSMDALFSYVECCGDYQQRQVLLEGIALGPHVDRGVLQTGCESELATSPKHFIFLKLNKTLKSSINCCLFTIHSAVPL